MKLPMYTHYLVISTFIQMSLTKTVDSLIQFSGFQLRLIVDLKPVELWESAIYQKLRLSKLVWLQKWNWKNLYSYRNYKPDNTLGVDLTPSLLSGL